MKTIEPNTDVIVTDQGIECRALFIRTQAHPFGGEMYYIVKLYGIKGKYKGKLISGEFGYSEEEIRVA